MPDFFENLVRTYYPERAAEMLTPRARGLSGFIQTVQQQEAGLARDPVLARRMLAGPLTYRRTGAEYVATVAQAIGIAFSPLGWAPAFGGPTVSLLESLTGFANLATSVGQAYQAFQRPRAAPPPPAYAGGLMQTGGYMQQAAFPMLGPIAGGAMRALPALGLGGAVALGGRVAVMGARRLYSSAAGYCRRNPGWCASIGGLAAVEGLIRSGQLPPIRHRRGRGISSKEFRSFRRVHGVLSKFCAPKVRIKRSKR